MTLSQRRYARHIFFFYRSVGFTHGYPLAVPLALSEEVFQL